MSWHFSRALAEEYSRATCSDGGQSAPSNTSPMPHLYSSSDRMMDFCRRSRSGMTCGPLTDALGEELLTWFLEGSHARTSALPERAQASQVKDPASGKKWRESFAKYDRDSRSWRTARSLPLAGLILCSVTWPRWGSMRNGVCSVARSLAPCAKASEFGLSLLRSTAQCWKAWTFKSLQSLVRKNHSDGNIQEQSARCFRRMITAESNEILMKWPSKWTGLKPLETGRFRQWLQEHGLNCHGG